MRDILFRGFYPDEDGYSKTFVNGEWVKGTWVYGDLISIPNKNYYAIMPQTAASYTIQVIHATVCQYTGLKDKNGKKIFDGDIIKHYNGCDIKEYSVDTGRVFFYPQTMRYLRTSTLFPDDCHEIYDNNEYEVIGNIFENPELIENASK
jgi:uncharacterized phage protein (TIGR01671 family)